MGTERTSPRTRAQSESIEENSGSLCFLDWRWIARLHPDGLELVPIDVRRATRPRVESRQRYNPWRVCATSCSAFHGDYPVNSAGVAQDAGVLAEIEDVLAALADADAFAAQFEADGLFADLNVDAEGENTRVDDYPSPAAIFGRPRGELRIVSAATDFTRLGAWRHRVSANAVSGLAD